MSTGAKPKVTAPSHVMATRRKTSISDDTVSSGIQPIGLSTVHQGLQSVMQHADTVSQIIEDVRRSSLSKRPTDGAAAVAQYSQAAEGGSASTTTLLQTTDVNLVASQAPLLPLHISTLNVQTAVQEQQLEDTRTQYSSVTQPLQKTYSRLEGDAAYRRGNARLLDNYPPTETPTSFSDRRSPQETSDDDINLLETPYGGGINHQLIGYRSPVNILPQQPSIRHVESCISNLRERIQLFGTGFCNRPGWIGELESKISRFRAEIEEISDKCQTMVYLDQLDSVYTLSADLEKYIDSFRTKARAEKENNSAPFSLRNLTLTPDRVPAGGSGHPILPTTSHISRNQPPEQDDATVSEGEDTNRTFHSRVGNRYTLSESVRDLKIRVMAIEKTTSSYQSLESRMLAVEVNKANQLDLSGLQNQVENSAQIIANLRKAYEEKFAEQEEIINTLEGKVIASSVACVRYENLAKGFCRENVKFREDLKVAYVKIMSIAAELHVLRSEVQARPNTRDLQREDACILQAAHSVQTCTGIPGINQIPSTLVTTLSNTTTGLTSSTSTVMSTRIQASTVNVIPSSNPIFVTSRPPSMQQNFQPMTDSQPYAPYQHCPEPQSMMMPQDQIPQSQGNQCGIPNYNSYNNPSPPQYGRRDRSYSDRDSSPNGSVSTPLSNTNHLSRLGIRLKKAGIALKRMLTPPVDNNLTKVTVQSVHAGLLSAVDAERKHVNNLLDKYDNPRDGPVDQQLLNEIEDIIQDSQEWCMGMREKHRELDCSKKPLDKKLYDGMKKFGEDPEVNIFEFLKKFESYTEEKGTAQERAALLYDHYLLKEAQMELVERRDNYDLMKTWLIRKFGDVRVITENILKLITKDPKPNESASPATLTVYYRKLNSVIKRILELNKTIKKPDLEAHIYSYEFMARLLSYVPDKARYDFMDKLIDAGEDLDNIHGSRAFSILSKTVFRHFCLENGSEKVDSASGVNKATRKHSPTRKSSPSKPRKGAHAVMDLEQSSFDDEESRTCVHFQNTQQSKKKDSKPVKNKSKFKFPCILNKHNHEIGECNTFFKMTSTERKKAAYKKMCYSCLGPLEKCKRNDCVNSKEAAAADLHCRECKEWADQNDHSPTNILLCTGKNHTKPDNNTLVTNLQKYLKDFNPGKVKDPIKLTAHLHIVAHANNCSDCKSADCDCSPPTFTSKVDPNAETPIIDTQTGESVTVDEDNIIKESAHDAFYIMQTLNMRGRDVLAFFDRGANQHLIEGQLAEDISLKVVSDRPVSVGVLGGGGVWTQYGMYSVCLGPTEEGHYYEITAQGIYRMTAEFPRYDLTDVNKETRRSGLLPKGNALLPKCIGGQRAKLLIGIKSTGLDPVQIFQLPSGLAIFKSPIADKYGSRYCYGGPHAVFSSVNQMNNVNHVNAFFLEVTNQYRNSLYPRLATALEPEYTEGDAGIMFLKNSSPKAKMLTEEGMEVYPTAVSDTDIAEMGILEVGPESEDLEETCICSPLADPKPCITSVSMSIHKAKIPISKRKEYIDEEDMAFGEGYRCSDCAQCKKCLVSDRSKMMSLQEQIEQDAIRKSVYVDLEQKKVFVDLPFIKPPVDALKKRHNGADNNYYQALRIYQAQCRKPEQMKEEMRKVHHDLVDRGFMKKLCDLDLEQQSLIRNAGFKHHMPWRIAEKQDSISTPYRMVVDASVTGINEILAKGENNMTKINDILIRNRCRRTLWSSDISKLYNQLHLRDSALPYGLFLFDEKMDPKADPEIYVMVVAWYGVTSTGNQSREALERLVTLLEDKYPAATDVIRKDCYVDDVLSGGNDDATVNKQIDDTKAVLMEGGFQLKYCVKSGEPPSKDASPDEKSLKILGYRWTPEEDYLAPGFGEINFSKKRRGSKRPNPFPVVNPSDVTKLLDSCNVTRRMVVSKIAEIWDPVGIWEPFKLQLKLDNHKLNGLDWDFALEPDLQDLWKTRFQEFLHVPDMTAERCIVPDDAENPDQIRLLCISDAAEVAGGCAIYAGFKKRDGSYSCKLLTSRSKLLHHTIPRNELEGIKLMAETAVNVKNALGDKVVETLFFTDSTIAMCWCHNLNKKLRMFTLYRVADIRRAIVRATGIENEEDLPLYHIDGKINIADLLTKPNSVTPRDICKDSEWQNGLPWMKLPLSEMPIVTYQDLKLSKDEQQVIDQECFPDPILSNSNPSQDNVHGVHLGECKNTHCCGCTPSETYTPLQVCYGTDDLQAHCDNCGCQTKFSSFALKVGRGSQVIDIIKHGWLKSLRVLSYALRFIFFMVHKLHISKGIKESDTCKFCTVLSATGGLDAELADAFIAEAKTFLFRQESERIRTMLPQKKLSSFQLKDGIYYHDGRLSEENPITQSDLGFDVFFDNTEIKSLLPIVLANSELFFCYAMYVHNKVRLHAGVELTYREISKTMMVLNNPRRIIQKIRRDCPRCRIIAKRTLELKMSHHPAARTHIAPPFYHCQMDTVYGFKGQSFKNARKTFKIYALLIVCLLTGATSILAIEGLESQDVIQAIERHSARHGVPSVIYVDNGTQLVSLENTEFRLRDMQAQLHDSLGLKVVVSTAKSHEARGRAEAKVKILRSMLEKLAIKAETAMTAIQWETLFFKISSQIDDVPIAKTNSSNLNDPGWSIITANRLKLGRNNNRSLEGSINLLKGAGITALLRRNQELQKVWYQLFIDKIHHLIPRPAKWTTTD